MTIKAPRWPHKDLNPRSIVTPGVTIGGAILATAIFVACFSIRSTHEWRFFPTLLSRVHGFEPHTKLRKTTDFLWTSARAEVTLPLRLTGSSRLGIVLSSPAGPRRVTLYSNDARSLPAIVDGDKPTTIDFGVGGISWRRLTLSIEAARLNARTRGVRAHALRLRRDSGWMLPDINVLIAYAATLLLLVIVLGRLGFSARSAWTCIIATICVPSSIMAAVDPLAAAHLCLRLLVWIPIVLLLCMSLFSIVVRRLPIEYPRSGVVQWTTVFFMTVLILRGGWLLHPRHYHKDEPIHAQMSRIALEDGVADLWRNIESYQARYFLGTHKADSGLTVIKYPPTFYSLSLIPNLLQRAFGFSDDVYYWNKLLAVVMSAAQILPVLAVACRLGALPFMILFCGILEVFSPVEMHELACVSFSATMGKLTDLVLLSYLILKAPRLRWTGASVLMLLCLMSYVASWINIAVICGLYAVVALFDRQARVVMPRLIAAGLLAIVVASLIFYGDLWLQVFSAHLNGGHSIEGLGDRWSAFANPMRWLWGEISPYYTPMHIMIWLVGLLLTIRSPLMGVGRGWWLAWNMALIALPALQCLGGGVMEYYRSAHLTMPLISICGAIVLSRCWSSRRSHRIVALGLLMMLVSLQIVRIVRMIPPYFVRYDAMLLPAWPF